MEANPKQGFFFSSTFLSYDIFFSGNPIFHSGKYKYKFGLDENKATGSVLKQQIAKLFGNHKQIN